MGHPWGGGEKKRKEEASTTSSLCIRSGERVALLFSRIGEERKEKKRRGRGIYKAEHYCGRKKRGKRVLV